MPCSVDVSGKSALFWEKSGVVKDWERREMGVGGKELEGMEEGEATVSMYYKENKKKDMMKKI